MTSSRNWLMTLNHPKVEAKDYLEKIFRLSKAKYCCGQLEKGKEGTPHLQFFLNFKEPCKASKIKKLDKELHIEIVRINNGAHDYCMKEETRLDGPYEFG